jgi:hypothetical protein
VLDGPVEIEARLDMSVFNEAADLADEDSSPGGIFRNRAAAAAARDQHQQAPDEGPGKTGKSGQVRPTGPVGLPRRRKPPTLVTDHGRRVDTPQHAQDELAPEAGDSLPRRVRQANLAPQLREAPAPAAEPQVTGDNDERDADEVRSRMASLQRGWQRGRRDNSAQDSVHDSAESSAVGTGPAESGPGTTSEGTGR